MPDSRDPDPAGGNGTGPEHTNDSPAPAAEPGATHTAGASHSEPVAGHTAAAHATEFVFDGSAYVAVSHHSRGRRRRGPWARLRRLIRHHRRALAAAMMVVGGFVIFGAAWTGWRAYQAYTHLDTARALVADAAGEIGTQGLAALPQLRSRIDALAGETAAAHGAVDDPIYRLVTHVPLLGDNLEAVRTVAASLDGIAQSAKTALPALKPLTDTSGWASGGHFDLDVLRPAAQSVIDLNAAVQHAIDAVTSNDRARLIGPINDALNEYGSELTTLSGMTLPGAQAAAITMPILGADGPRTYLIAFQNLAEARPTGGIFGFYATLKVADGTLTLGPAGASDRDFGYFPQPVIQIPDHYEQLYWPGMAQWPQDVNFSPDFPTAAESFAAMYQKHSGQHVDGVIALDPVVVATLMKGVAPIDLGEGLSLSSDTAVHLLSAGIYDAFPGGARLAERDAMMKRAVGEAFSAVLSNAPTLEPRELIDDVHSLIDLRHILVWSAHDDDESLILTTAVAGRLPATDPPQAPTVGLFAVDGNGGKMSYYLTGDVTLGAATCAPSGAASLPLTMTVRNTAPKDGLPPYVVSGADHDADGYRLVTNFILAAPPGGSVVDLKVDGTPAPKRVGYDHGREVTIFSATLRSGASATVTATVTTAAPAATAAEARAGSAGGHVTPRLVVSPLAKPFATHVASFTECGSISSNG